MVTPLDVYKYLPKTNCKKCGVDTCIAFSIQLINRQAKIEDCIPLSEENKIPLNTLLRLPIKEIEIGIKNDAIKVGGEEILYRHDKKFNNPPALGLMISDKLQKSEIVSKIKDFNSFFYERIGTSLKFDILAISFDNGNLDVINIVKENYSGPLILKSSDPKIIEGALARCESEKSLIYGINENNWDEMLEIAKKHNCPVVVSENTSLKGLEQMIDTIKSKNFDDIIINVRCDDFAEYLQKATILRRFAVDENSDSFGYPIITDLTYHSNPNNVMSASLGILKYASIILLDKIDYTDCLPLLVLRQNIYADPQKPIQIEAKLYEIGNPNENSPVLLTTNFSLTYFSVTEDIGASKIPAYLIVAPVEGLSVLTAWGAGTLDAELIAKSIQKSKIEKKVSHKKLIIPGLIAHLKGEIEEESGWDVIVGPRDSSKLLTFLAREAKT